MTPVAIALAGGIGAALRHLAETALGPRASGRLPWALLLVNATGSAVLGALVGAGTGGDALLVVGTGLCGGFTTFSAASLDAATRSRDGLLVAGASAVTMLTVSVAAATLGHALGSAAWS